MFWVILALSSALLQSARDLFTKKILQALDEYLFVFADALFSTLCLLPIILFLGIPEIDCLFWFALLSNGGLLVIARVLYIKAIQRSALSLIAPLSAFTPLFLLVTSPLMLGEVPSNFGFIGVVVVVVGMYMLSIKDVSQGIFAPFKALMKEKGAVFALIVAFLYSIGSNLVKIGVQHSNPFFFSLMTMTFLSSVSFPLMLMKSPNSLMGVRSNFKVFILLGVVIAFQSILTMQAMEIALVP